MSSQKGLVGKINEPAKFDKHAIIFKTIKTIIITGKIRVFKESEFASFSAIYSSDFLLYNHLSGQ